MLIQPDFPDYGGARVCLGLSGGINSAAMLVHLGSGSAELKPAELHLVYHHFAEHSPDTKPFVAACSEWARQHFPKVVYHETDNSVLSFFEDNKMIPHPARSPCTRMLKQLPMRLYMAQHGITHNPVGYVKGEANRRAGKMADRTDSLITNVVDNGVKVQFPISAFDDEWCFKVVEEAIGWYPAIYHHRWNDPGFMAFMLERLPSLTPEGQRAVRKRLGTTQRVFDHNNCLPCKNLMTWQLLCVEYFYPDYMARARQTEVAVGRHWGNDEAAYYAQFGKHERDPSAGSSCSYCAA